MSEFYMELIAAMKLADMPENEITEKEPLLKNLKDTFISGNPYFWWNSLKIKPKSFSFQDDTGYLHLTEIAPPTDENVYFIADEDGDEKYVFEIPLSKTKDILKECRFFEYYITPKDFSWLIMENDHGEILFVSTSMAQ